MTPEQRVRDRLVRELDSVGDRYRQTGDLLKVVQAELDRAVSHEQRLWARFERYRSQSNREQWAAAWERRDALEQELRHLTAQHHRLAAQQRQLTDPAELHRRLAHATERAA